MTEAAFFVAILIVVLACFAIPWELLL